MFKVTVNTDEIYELTVSRQVKKYDQREAGSYITVETEVKTFAYYDDVLKWASENGSYKIESLIRKTDMTKKLKPGYQGKD